MLTWQKKYPCTVIQSSYVDAISLRPESQGAGKIAPSHADINLVAIR